MLSNNLLYEALVVGLATVVVGTIVGYALSKYMKNDVSDDCKDWNKNNIMEWSLFLTGVAVHLLSEYSGMNVWYCKYGNACLKNKSTLAKFVGLINF